MLKTAISVEVLCVHFLELLREFFYRQLVIYRFFSLVMLTVFGCLLYHLLIKYFYMLKKNKLRSIAKWWFSPKFPYTQFEKITKYSPDGFKNKINNAIRSWFIHPIKRRIAKYYLVLLKRLTNIKVVAITGSAGKTSTKDMLFSILSLGGKTVSSYKNIDPVFNIPTTILKCNPSTKYLVLEMGVEYPGEIDYYFWLAKPDISVITNIYATHTEFFKNTDGVFREKSKAAKFLNKDSVVVLNLENKYTARLSRDMKATINLFGKGSGLFAENVKIGTTGQTSFDLIDKTGEKTEKQKIVINSAGKQFVENALAAIAVSRKLETKMSQIKKGLLLYKPDQHRMKFIKYKGGTIIDDTYNSNPEAFKKALEMFDDLNFKKKYLVFGDMLELGKDEMRFHRQAGKHIAKSKIGKVIFVGELSKYAKNELDNKKIESYHFDSWEKAKARIVEFYKDRPSILIKGSRSVGLDNLVSHLLEN